MSEASPYLWRAHVVGNLPMPSSMPPPTEQPMRDETNQQNQSQQNPQQQQQQNTQNQAITAMSASTDNTNNLDEQFEDDLQRAASLLQSNDVRGAEDAIRHLLGRAPRNEQVRNLLGLLHVKKGALDDAERVFADLVIQHPRDATLHLNLALVLMRQQRYSEAEPHLQAVLSVEPEHPRARIYLEQVRNLIDVPRADSVLPQAASAQEIFTDATTDAGADNSVATDDGIVSTTHAAQATQATRGHDLSDGSSAPQQNTSTHTADGPLSSNAVAANMNATDDTAAGHLDAIHNSNTDTANNVVKFNGTHEPLPFMPRRIDAAELNNRIDMLNGNRSEKRQAILSMLRNGTNTDDKPIFMSSSSGAYPATSGEPHAGHTTDSYSSTNVRSSSTSTTARTQSIALPLLPPVDPNEGEKKSEKNAKRHDGIHMIDGSTESVPLPAASVQKSPPAPMRLMSLSAPSWSAATTQASMLAQAYSFAFRRHACVRLHSFVSASGAASGSLARKVYQGQATDVLLGPRGQPMLQLQTLPAHVGVHGNTASGMTDESTGHATHTAHTAQPARPLFAVLDLGIWAPTWLRLQDEQVFFLDDYLQAFCDDITWNNGRLRLGEGESAYQTDITELSGSGDVLLAAPHSLYRLPIDGSGTMIRADRLVGFGGDVQLSLVFSPYKDRDGRDGHVLLRFVGTGFLIAW